MSRLLTGFVLAWCLQSQLVAQVLPSSTLLVNENIISELQLTAEQKLRIKRILSPFTRVVNGKPQFILRSGINFDALEADIGKVLVPSQAKRLREAWLQVHGVMAILDPTINKELSLDDKVRWCRNNGHSFP